MNLKNKKIWLFALIALLIVAGIGVFYFTYNKGISKALIDEEQQVFVVSRRDIMKSVSLSGNLKYQSTEKLYFPIQGTVDTLFVEKGEKISAGKKIASLHREDISLIEKRLADLKKNLNDAQAQLRYLLSVGEPARKIDIDKEVRELEEALEQSKQQLSYLISVGESVADANANKEVRELEEALEQSKQQLSYLISVGESVADANANKEVRELEEALEQSKQRLADVLQTPQHELSAAQMSLLTLQQSLSDAVEALANLESPEPAAVAILEQSYAKALNRFDSAEQSYESLISGPNSDEVSSIESKIISASSTLYASKIDMKIDSGDWSDNISLAQLKLTEAEEDYLLYWRRWFGVENADLTNFPPEEIYQNWGVDLEILFDKNARRAEVRKFISNFAPDHGVNVWSEITVLAWLAFFPGQIHGTCDNLVLKDGELCVDREMHNSWDSLVDMRLELENTKTLAMKSSEIRQEAVRKSEDSLEEYKRQLIELKETPGTSVILSAQAELLIARSEMESSRRALDTFGDRHALNIAAQKQAVEIVMYEIADAEDELDELLKPSTKQEISSAQSEVVLGQYELDQSFIRIADVKDDFMFELDMQRAEIDLAQYELDQSLIRRDNIENDVQFDLDMQRAEIDLAQYELDQSLIRRDNIENDVQFDLDVQKAEISRLQAEINKAESDLEDTTITSPFDGVILSLPAFEGGKVNPGETVVEISHPNDFQLEGSIDEIDVLHITAGMNAFITIDAESSLNVSGVVEEISITPSVQQGVVSYSVTVGLESVPSVQLRDGLSAVAEIVIENSPNQIAIPLNAIRGPEDNPFVLIKTESAVENRAVRLGLSDDFWVSVVDGLDEGEAILVQGKPIVGEEFNMRSLRRPRGR